MLKLSCCPVSMCKAISESLNHIFSTSHLSLEWHVANAPSPATPEKSPQHVICWGYWQSHCINCAAGHGWPPASPAFAFCLFTLGQPQPLFKWTPCNGRAKFQEIYPVFYQPQMRKPLQNQKNTSPDLNCPRSSVLPVPMHTHYLSLHKWSHQVLWAHKWVEPQPLLYLPKELCPTIQQQTSSYDGENVQLTQNCSEQALTCHISICRSLPKLFPSN